MSNTITTDEITNELNRLNKAIKDTMDVNENNYVAIFEEIDILKTSKIEEVRAAAVKNDEKLNELMVERQDLNNSNTELKEKLKGLADINNQVDILRVNVKNLTNYNNTQATQIKGLKSGVGHEGGYQYKSKSKKSNSKRMLKLNRFGLLKSRSKSKKSKKKLRPKKHKKGRRKSVKKGGMKRKSSKKNKKKTKKSKKKHTKRK
tara:strand:- start:11681 stop:12292 length:612 start_codon:yes stop_codon:yes gene_type:complete